MTAWMRSPAGAVVVMLAAVAMALDPAGATAQGTPLGTPIPEKPLGTPLDPDEAPRAFLQNQLAFSRVVDARETTDARLRALFAEKGVAYPAPEIFLRVFKHERIMELWARSATDSVFTLIREYPVCALPGQLGPKQRMGDFQVPEGFYFIDGFNPRSSYHLSLRVSYPNLSDRMRREPIALGGDIFIHGGCATVGCIPIENDNIKEVYWLAAQSMHEGQRIIPIHIFPSRMDEATLRWLEATFDPEPRLRQFWRTLAEGHAYFEATRQVPWVTVAQDGSYTVPPLDRLADQGGSAGDSGSDILTLPHLEAAADSTATADSTAAPPSGGSRIP